MENTLKDIPRLSGDFSGNFGNVPADDRTFPTTGFTGLYRGIRQFMKAISPVTVSFSFFPGIPPEGGRRRSSRLRGAAVHKGLCLADIHPQAVSPAFLLQPERSRPDVLRVQQALGHDGFVLPDNIR